MDGTIEGAMRAGLASYVDDVQLRRRILVGLNRQERLHALARALFFGRQGRFGDRSYEAQLNRASALSLVINAIIVWNTEYLAAAAAELARRGQPVPDAAWSHITRCTGRTFTWSGTTGSRSRRSWGVSDRYASSGTKTTSALSVNFRRKANGRPR